MKHVLITGGESRLGIDLSKHFLEKGYFVSIADKIKPQETCYVENKRSFVCDLQRPESFKTLIEGILFETHLPITSLVNVARTTRSPGLLKEYSQDEEKHWIEDFQVHAIAPYFMTLAIAEIPSNLSSLESVINVSSVLSQSVSEAESSSYHASKAALDSVTRTLAIGLSQSNVRINSVRPGFLEDKLGRVSKQNSQLNERLSQTRVGTEILSTLDVYRVIEFLASDLSSGISGQCITIDRSFSNRENLDAIMRVTGSI